MLQERNREIMELHREMSDTFWPRARLLNCLGLCAVEPKRRGRAKQGRKQRGENKTENLKKFNKVD